MKVYGLFFNKLLLAVTVLVLLSLQGCVAMNLSEPKTRPTDAQKLIQQLKGHRINVSGTYNGDRCTKSHQTVNFLKYLPENEVQWVTKEALTDQDIQIVYQQGGCNASAYVPFTNNFLAILAYGGIWLPSHVLSLGIIPYPYATDPWLDVQILQGKKQLYKGSFRLHKIMIGGSIPAILPMPGYVSGDLQREYAERVFAMFMKDVASEYILE